MYDNSVYGSFLYTREKIMVLLDSMRTNCYFSSVNLKSSKFQSAKHMLSRAESGFYGDNAVSVSAG